MSDKKKFYSFTNDRMFKTMMKNEKFRSWLGESIMYVTGVDISKFELISTELTEGNMVKQYVLDTLLKDKKNNYVIIEMQNTQADLKNLRYLYRVAGNIVNKGEKDENIHSNVTLIQLDGYVPYNNVVGNILHITFQDSDKKVVKEGIEMYEIVLPNFKSECYNEYTNRFAMLGCNDLESMGMYATSKESKEVLGELIRMNEDELLRFAMEKDEYDALIRASEREEGYEVGLDEGREQERNSAISSMIYKGYKDEEILEIFKISQEELDKIKSSLNEGN